MIRLLEYKRSNGHRCYGLDDPHPAVGVSKNKWFTGGVVSITVSSPLVSENSSVSERTCKRSSNHRCYGLDDPHPAVGVSKNKWFTVCDVVYTVVV